MVEESGPRGGATDSIEAVEKLGVIPVSLPLGKRCRRNAEQTTTAWSGAAAPIRVQQIFDISKPMTFLP